MAEILKRAPARPLGPSGIVFFCAASACLFATALGAARREASSVQIARPPITGIARVRVWVSNAQKAAAFYEKLLGFAPSASGGPKEMLACLVVNGRQEIQLMAEPSPAPKNRIAEVVFATPGAARMRAYLISRGYAPGALSSSAEGLQFRVSDPEGNAIGFLQPRFRPAARREHGQISARIIHAGFIVHDRAAEDRFYKGALGFHLYWQGGMTDKQINWVSMQAPDGRDWLEYMLRVAPDASPRVIGIMNHFSLGVRDIQAAKEQFLKNGGQPPEEPKLGRDGKWQLNLYDPDGTRVEVMEFLPKAKPCCSPFTGKHPLP